MAHSKKCAISLNLTFDDLWWPRYWPKQKNGQSNVDWNYYWLSNAVCRIILSFLVSETEVGVEVKPPTHVSLEGVGSVLTSKVCHSKADILVPTETQLFWKSIGALFQKIILFNICHLSPFACAAGNSMAEAQAKHMLNVLIYPAQ